MTLAVAEALNPNKTKTKSQNKNGNEKHLPFHNIAQHFVWLSPPLSGYSSYYGS